MLKFFIKFLANILLHSCICFGQNNGLESPQSIEIVNPRIYISSRLEKNQKIYDFQRLVYERKYRVLAGKIDTRFLRDSLSIALYSLFPIDDNSESIDYAGKKFKYSSNPTLRESPYDEVRFEPVPFILSKWNAEIPNWYKGTITPIYQDKKLLPSFQFYQGFRSFRFVNKKAELNGETLYFKPIYYKSLFADTNQSIENVISLKKANINTVIINRYNKNWLKMCDSLGIYNVIMIDPPQSLNSCENKKMCLSQIESSNYLDTLLELYDNKTFVNPSLLFFVLKSDNEGLLQALNENMSFYNRDLKNVYSQNEINELGLFQNIGIIEGDKAIHESENKKIIEYCKQKYQLVDIEILDISKSMIKITNEYDFLNLQDCRLEWKITKNQEILTEGAKQLSKVAPHESITIKLLESDISFFSNQLYKISIKVYTGQHHQWFFKQQEIGIKMAEYQVQAR